MRRKLLYLSLLMVVAATPPLRAQQEGPLQIGIVGSESGKSQPNYSGVMQHVPVQRLMLDLAAAPRDRAYVEQALAGTGVSTADLESLELVRRDGERFVLSFTLFTASDIRNIHDVSERYARTLAAYFLARRGEIDAVLRRYDAPGVDRTAVAYIVLGCFSLDWDGLALTAQKGFRTTAKPRPGGDAYIPWAEEKSEISLQRVFWGSHNAEIEDVQFTSFGDHHSLPRHVLPDLIWRAPGRLRQSDLPDGLKPPLGRILQQSLERLAVPAAHMLFALRSSEQTREVLVKESGLPEEEAEALLALLMELDYVAEKDGRYSARVPVLTNKDAAFVRDLRRLGWQIMDSWLAVNYKEVRAELGEVTPMRYGVSYAHGFTQVWHWLFGMANRKLVEAGLFADPYAKDRKFKGFIPAVFHAELSRGIP